MKHISVAGMGKLGAPLAACFASKGAPAIGIDNDLAKVDLINQGLAPVYEPGLQELIKASGVRLAATHDYESAVRNSEATFIVVPTPSDERGSFSLRFVLEAAERIGRALSQKTTYHLVVITSTVMPGAMEEEIKPLLEISSGKECGRDFGLCYNPEFVALGNVIRGILNPDFVLIGESDSLSGEILANFYKEVCENDPAIARMNFINAEITKLAVNTFITTKITFANVLARVCEKLSGADVDVVTRALGKDSRIGQEYLKGAIGYGGPCFPRDNIAFDFLARKLGIPETLAEATDRLNQLQITHLMELLKSKLPPGGVVGILGLSYKPDTDVVEESQGLLLAQALQQAAIPVIAYDPAGTENARKLLNGSVRFAGCAEECVQESDVIVITTPWKEFRRIEPKVLERAGSPRTIIDCWRLLDQSVYEKIADYIPLGIGVAAAETVIKSGLEDPNL